MSLNHAVGGAGNAIKVFLSYRHEDTQGTAWGIYHPLREHFGRENIFFDNGTLRAGDQWLREIESYLDETDVFLALIGSQWMRSLTHRGHQDEPDYVAHEVAVALQRRLPVIAVLVDGTDPPDARQLPVSLKGLTAGHVAQLRHAHLEDDVAALIKRLDEIAESGDRPRDVAEPLTKIAAPESHGDASAAVPAQVLATAPAVRVAPAPDDEHYEAVVREAWDSRMIVFLGANVNAEDLPSDDEQLAQYLVTNGKLGAASGDLAEIAQQIRDRRGDPKLFELIKQGLGNHQPGPVQRYLAALPERFEQLGLERRHQMIVTPKYDAALERALRETNPAEPFDSVIYMGPGTTSPGRWVHVPWGGPPVTIQVPREYLELPIRDDELERTLVVRIHGSVDDPDLNYTVKNNYVVTEDHYIQYLSGAPLTELVPVQILEKLRNSSYLFLGYSVRDWRLRVFLKRLWESDSFGSAPHWAVERTPTRRERDLWRQAQVELCQSSLTEYVEGLDRFLEAHRQELIG